MNGAPPPGFRVEVSGQTLVAFLAERLGISKAKAKDCLDARRVFVNGRRVWMARHPLARGDRVEVAGQLPASTSAPTRPPALPRLHEDEAVLVVDKPAGMASNDRPGSAEAVLHRAGAAHWLPVHRLDTETTGCLLFAASPALKAALVEQFRAREVRKVYEAIALGAPDRDSFSLRAPLDGQSAVTHVQVQARSRRAARLRVEIETGRTHQIRRHLAGIGHPVVGDKQYAGKLQWDADLRACPRHLLHAAEIAFRHPLTGAEVRVRAPRPADFREWSRKLGLPA
jgi:RluA family pseudouridine synthase